MLSPLVIGFWVPTTLMYRDPSEERIVENFLDEEGIDEEKKIKILQIIKGMGEYFLFYVIFFL